MQDVRFFEERVEVVYENCCKKMIREQNSKGKSIVFMQVFCYNKVSNFVDIFILPEEEPQYV